MSTIAKMTPESNFTLVVNGVLRITNKNKSTTKRVPPIPAATTPGQGSIGT